MSDEIYFVVEELPEGSFQAHALEESIFAEAGDLKRLYQQVRDAVSGHFDQGDAPETIHLQFIREEVIGLDKL